MAKTNNIPLLVTTKHKGVFFGYGQPTDAKTIRLERARMCVKFSSDIRGVLGLASKGPNSNCRIGFEVPSIILQDVTSITEVSPEAEGQFQKEPWL